MDGPELLIPLIAVIAIFIILPGMIFHYITLWRKQKMLLPDDERMLEDLWRSAKAIERRIETIEELMDAQDEVLTAEIKINLLAPARGDMLRATGRVIKPGRRLIVVDAQVHAIADGVETLIAVLQGTMVPVSGATASA